MLFNLHNNIIHHYPAFVNSYLNLISNANKWKVRSSVVLRKYLDIWKPRFEVISRRAKGAMRWHCNRRATTQSPKDGLPLRAWGLLPTFCVARRLSAAADSTPRVLNVNKIPQANVKVFA